MSKRSVPYEETIECPECHGNFWIIEKIPAEEYDPKLYPGRKYLIDVAHACPLCNKAAYADEEKARREAELETPEKEEWWQK